MHHKNEAEYPACGQIDTVAEAQNDPVSSQLLNR